MLPTDLLGLGEWELMAPIKFARRAEEHAKPRHFLINMSVPKLPKIALEPPEHPKIGKHLINKHLWAFSAIFCCLNAKS